MTVIATAMPVHCSFFFFNLHSVHERRLKLDTKFALKFFFFGCGEGVDFKSCPSSGDLVSLEVPTWNSESFFLVCCLKTVLIPAVKLHCKFSF